MVDIVLLGTKEAGKTTMLSILRGKGVPNNKPPQTDGHLSKDISKVQRFDSNLLIRLFNRISIHDTGGKDTNLSTDYYNWISEAEKVCFVFNGINFLDEIDSNKGGEIGMRIRNWLLPNFGPQKPKQFFSLFFIATHADLFDGDLRQTIIERISYVNKEYQKLTSTNNYRYTYLNLFEDPSHFFAINAENEDEVKAVFEVIFSQDTKVI